MFNDTTKGIKHGYRPGSERHRKGTYVQIASKHSSMVSLCALVRERPLESLYIVCSVESIREV
jgi:hypothetical protein